MRRLIAPVIVALTLLVSNGFALADTSATNFDAFTLGNPAVDQNGWTFGVPPGPHDVAIVDNTAGGLPYSYPSFGTKSFRISNATASGDLTEWVLSAPLAQPAGESTAQSYSESSFDFASHNPAGPQMDTTSARSGCSVATPCPLQIGVAPTSGGGERMSFARLRDTSTSGLQIVFFDYIRAIGSPCDQDFVPTLVATGLDRTKVHNIRFGMTFIPGASNDVVRLYVDGTLVHTGTSWEDFYNDGCDPNPNPPAIDRVVFVAREATSCAGSGVTLDCGAEAPTLAGKGFLIDNFNMRSSAAPMPPTISKAFVPATIAVGGTSTMRFTLANPNNSTLSSVGFTDDFSATAPGLTIKSPLNQSVVCGGASSLAPSVTAGGTSVTLSNGTLAPGDTCTISVDVTPSTSGSKTNTTSAITSLEGGNGAASNPATLLVPGIATSLVPPSPVAIGTAVHDTATLIGVTGTAGGTVTYSVYTNNTCTTPYTGHQPTGNPAAVTNGAVANSGNVTFDQAGTFYWQAVYSGDANNAGAVSPCTSETITVGQNAPTLATSLVPPSPVAIGTAVHDTATLTGATATAGGTVTYSVYTNNTCTTPYAGHQPTGNPAAVTNGAVANSGNVTFDQAGTFYWQAAYSGDANNAGAVSPCTTLVVNPFVPVVTTTSPATAITQTSATLAGNVSADGGAPVTARGFVLADNSVNPTPTLGGAGVMQVLDAGTGVGAFSDTASGLMPGVNYAFRAFATNSAGTSYGAVVIFTTATQPPPMGVAGPKQPVPVPAPTQLPPAITKKFNGSNNATIATAGGTATLTFSISNPNATPLTGIGFLDTMPAGSGITVNAGSTAGSCDGGIILLTSSTVSLAGAALPASGSCSFSVTVTAATGGSWTNQVVANANGTGPGAPSVATLNVAMPKPPKSA